MIISYTYIEGQRSSCIATLAVSIILALMSAHSTWLLTYLGRFYIRLKFICMSPPVVWFYRDHYSWQDSGQRSHMGCGSSVSPPKVAKGIFYVMSEVTLKPPPDCFIIIWEDFT